MNSIKNRRSIFYAQLPVQASPNSSEQIFLEGCYLERLGVGEMSIGDIKTGNHLGSFRGDDVHMGCRFGYSFDASVDAEWVVVGAPNYRKNTDICGKLYLFKRDDGMWVQTDSITTDTQSHTLGFRTAISTDGKQVISCGYNPFVASMPENGYELVWYTLVVDENGKFVECDRQTFKNKKWERPPLIVQLGIEDDEIKIVTTDVEYILNFKTGEVILEIAHF